MCPRAIALLGFFEISWTHTSLIKTLSKINSLPYQTAMLLLFRDIEINILLIIIVHFSSSSTTVAFEKQFPMM